MSLLNQLGSNQYNAANANMQNAYNTGNMGNIQSSLMNQMGRFPDPAGFTDKELERMIEVFAKEYDRRTMDTPLQGPTRRQLKENESLGNAWNEMMVIWKLIGDKK